MAFCGKCGAPLDDGKFCPQCGAPREDLPAAAAGSRASGPVFTPSGAAASAASRKKLIPLIGVALVVVIAVFLIFGNKTVNEPCDWCGNSPSVVYQTSSGREAYICKDCSKTCMLCGKKASHQYEKLLGTITFVCDNCYKQLKQ